MFSSNAFGWGFFGEASVITGVIYSDSNTTKLSFTPGVTEGRESAEVGTVPFLLAIASSAEVSTSADSQTEYLDFVPGGSDVRASVEASTAVVVATPISGDILASTDSQTTSFKLTASSSEVGAFVEASVENFAMMPSSGAESLASTDAQALSLTLTPSSGVESRVPADYNFSAKLGTKLGNIEIGKAVAVVAVSDANTVSIAFTPSVAEIRERTDAAPVGILLSVSAVEIREKADSNTTALTLIPQPFTVYSSELLSNPSFTSNVTGWIAQGATVTWDGTVGRTALGSAKVVTPGSTSQEGLAQNVPTAPLVKVGDRVEASAWVYSDISTTLVFTIIERDINNAGTGGASTQNFPVVPGWNYVVLQRTLTDAAAVRASLKVLTQVVVATTYYVDDISFRILSPSSPELISNPDFEINTTGWLIWQNSTISRDTANSNSGTASLLVHLIDGTGNAGTRTQVTLPASTPHTFSAWVKAPAGQSMFLSAYGNAMASQLASVGFTGTGSWQRVRLMFTSYSVGTTVHDFFVHRSGTNIFDYNVDDVSLRQIAEYAQFTDSVSVPLALTSSAVEIQAATGTDFGNALLTFNPSSADITAYVDTQSLRVAFGASSTDVLPSADTQTASIALMPSSSESGAFRDDSGGGVVLLAASTQEFAGRDDSGAGLVLLAASAQQFGARDDAAAGLVLLAASAQEFAANDDGAQQLFVTIITTTEEGKFSDDGAVNAALTITVIEYDPYYDPGVSGPARIIQKAKNQLSSATSVSKAFTSNVTGGGIGLAFVGWQTNGIHGLDGSVTDSQGNIWTPVPNSLADDDFFNATLQAFTTVFGSNGSCTVTGNSSAGHGNTIMDLYIYEIAGASVVDAANKAKGSTGPNYSLTASAADDLVLAAEIVSSRGTVSGWTNELTNSSFSFSDSKNSPVSAGTVTYNDAGNSGGAGSMVALLSSPVILPPQVTLTPSGTESPGTAGTNYADSATASLLLTPAITEIYERVDAATPVVVLSASAAEVRERVEAATVNVVFTESSVESVAFVETSTALIVTFPGQADVLVSTDANAAKMVFSPSGTETAGAGNITADAVTAFITFTPSVIETVAYGDVLQAKVVFAPSGTEFIRAAVNYIDSALAVVVFKPSAIDQQVAKHIVMMLKGQMETSRYHGSPVGVLIGKTPSNGAPKFTKVWR